MGLIFWKYYSGSNVEKAPTWDRETVLKKFTEIWAGNLNSQT